MFLFTRSPETLREKKTFQSDKNTFMSLRVGLQGENSERCNFFHSGPQRPVSGLEV
jgi:hypothetical protein